MAVAEREKQTKSVQASKQFVAFTVVMGVVLILVGWFADIVWSWAAVITGTFTSVGAAFLLAYVIFRMERAFADQITKQVDDTTRAIVRGETTELSTRIDQLSDRIGEQRQTTEQTQSSVIDDISSDVSYDTISAALEEAKRVGAIGQAIIVPGSSGDPRIQAGFSWRPRIINVRLNRPEGEPDGTGDHLDVEVVLVPGGGVYGQMVFGTEWAPSATGETVAADLEEQLRRGGRQPEAKGFDLSYAVTQLQGALRVAIADQQAAAGSERLRGGLKEVITGGWMITSEGLQHPESGYFSTPGELGIQPLPKGRGFAVLSGFAPPDPAAPDGVDGSYWEFIFSRVRMHF